MTQQRIYIDTSVVGGYFDKEFAVPTIQFFEKVSAGSMVIIVSDLLLAELLSAPPFVNSFLQSFESHHIEKVFLSEEARNLAEKYIEAGVVGATSKADCQHIAIATVAKADALVSWNFKHIVNLRRIKGYNGINYQNGYSMIEIRTPKELLNYE